MSDYTKITNYAAKDLLLHLDPAKLVKGAEVGAEFDAIATMSATKTDKTILAASGGSALVGYLPAGTGAVATTVQSKLRESVSVGDFTGADFSIKLQAAIDSLPATGGVIHAESITGDQTFSQQVTCNKPVRIILGGAKFTVASTTTSPAIKITRSSSIEGLPGFRFTDSAANTRGFYGSHFVAGTGFTGYILGIVNVAPLDQFNAAKSSITDISIDGNAQAANGIYIEGSFNPRISRVLIANVTNGIYVLNGNYSQGWSEALNFEDVYIINPSRGIQLEGSAATTSFGHSKLEGIRIDLYSASSIGMYLKKAALYSSTVSCVTFWAAATATNSRGVYIEDVDLSALNSVWIKIYAEGTCASFKLWALGGTAVGMPLVIGSTQDCAAGSILYDLPVGVTFWELPKLLAMNGDFQTGTSGWLANANAILSSAASGQTGNCLRVTCDAVPTPNARATFNRIVRPRYRYRVIFWFKKGTAASGLVRIGISDSDDTYAGISVTDAIWTRYEATFKATVGTLYLTLYANGSADIAGQYSDYDSISIEELGYSLDV